MKTCKACGLTNVDEEEIPRYDVLNPEFDPETSLLEDFGPYCATDWENTFTGSLPVDN